MVRDNLRGRFCHLTRYFHFLTAALSKESAGEELDWNTVGNIITEHLENEVKTGILGH